MGTKAGELGAGTAKHPQPQEKGQKMLVRTEVPEGSDPGPGSSFREGRGKGVWNALGRRLGGD